VLSTWARSRLALPPARDPILTEAERAAWVAADADGTVRLSQHVEVHRFRRA